MRILINCSDKYELINGQHFLPGEHVHVEDDFGIKDIAVFGTPGRPEFVTEDLLSAYPQIKEAHVVLAERTKQVLEENGLVQFAQSIKEDMDRYEQPVADVALDVLKYAPVKVAEIDGMPVKEVVK